jgi:hypothetical protein
MENLSKNNNFAKKLFKYLDGLLLVDKSIDLILVFVGLLAALMVENYLLQKENESKYITYLTRIHTEMITNESHGKSYENSVLKYFDIAQDLKNLVNKGAKEPYDGINKILETKNTPFELKAFKSLSPDDFLNKGLYADIYHIYQLYEKLEKEIVVPKEALESYNFDYFNIYVKNLWGDNNVNENYIDFNYHYNLTTKNVPQLQLLLQDIKATSERIKEAIENELEVYGTNITSSRTYSDYYWISGSKMASSDFSDAIEYCKLGIEDLDKLNYDSTSNRFGELNSYRGRLNRNIVGSIKLLIEDGDTSYVKEDIIPFLKEWEKTGVYKEMCYIEYLDYYYSIKDFENFTRITTKLIVELDEYWWFQRNIFKWRDFMEKKEIQAILKTSNISLEEWKEYLDMKKID